jgi:hypothetical protein
MKMRERRSRKMKRKLRKWRRTAEMSEVESVEEEGGAADAAEVEEGVQEPGKITGRCYPTYILLIYFLNSTNNESKADRIQRSQNITSPNHPRTIQWETRNRD